MQNKALSLTGAANGKQLRSVRRHRHGVPAAAVIKEDKSGHTRDNAFLSRKAVDEKGIEIKTALIVCKAFHTRRCLMLYQMAFPDVKIKVCPVHCYNITKDNWYKSEKGIDRVLGEMARCGNQFIGDIKEFCNCSGLS